jgi:hypothetical protein
MKALRTPWAALAVAAAAAVAAPALLLTADPAPAPPQPPGRFDLPTRVEPTQPGTLSYALVAPPFTAGRKPAPPESAAGATPPPAAAQPPAPPPPPLPRLVGVASGGRGRAVALVKTGSGETLVLSSGASADGWRLVAVGRDQATFERAGERQTARLDFGNKNPVASAAAAPPVPQPQPSLEARN